MDESICWSAYLKDIGAVRGYLKNGEDIESKDRDGRTLLLNSISGDDIDIELVKLLIDAGANVNSQDNAGFTALHFCAQNKQPRIALLLIENDAKINTKDQWGNIPLLRALGSDEENIMLIELLMENGSDPYSKNESGISVMDHVLKLKNHPNHSYFKGINDTSS